MTDEGLVELSGERGFGVPKTRIVARSSGQPASCVGRTTMK